MKEMCKANKMELLCLQEMKLQRFGWREARDVWGQKKWAFVHEGASNMLAGILVVWNTNCIEVEEQWVGEFVVSIKCRSNVDYFCSSSSGVYGPNDSSKHEKLWEELEGGSC